MKDIENVRIFKREKNSDTEYRNCGSQSSRSIVDYLVDDTQFHNFRKMSSYILRVPKVINCLTTQ
jgi:hypothetical protein